MSSKNNKKNRRTKNQINQSMGPMRMAPVASARTMMTKKPQIRSTSSGKRIRHCELLDSVRASNLFNAASYDLNPGLEVFRFLSTEAKSWDMYKVHSMSFHYSKRIGTQTNGTVLIAVDYDPTDAPPATKQEMTVYEGAQYGVPWTDLTCRLDSKQAHMDRVLYYTRVGPDPQDPRWTDLGTLFIGVTGTPAEIEGQELGDLIVSYDVEFFKAQVSSGLQVPRNQALFKSNGAQETSTFNQVGSGTVAAVPEFNNIGIDVLEGEGAFGGTGYAAPEAGLYEFNTTAVPSWVNTVGYMDASSKLFGYVNGTIGDSQTSQSLESNYDSRLINTLREVVALDKGDIYSTTIAALTQTAAADLVQEYNVESIQTAIRLLDPSSFAYTQAGAFTKTRKPGKFGIKDIDVYRRMMLKADPTMSDAMILRYWRANEGKESVKWKRTKYDVKAPPKGNSAAVPMEIEKVRHEDAHIRAPARVLTHPGRPKPSAPTEAPTKAFVTTPASDSWQRVDAAKAAVADSFLR